MFGTTARVLTANIGGWVHPMGTSPDTIGIIGDCTTTGYFIISKG
jgi:hypothetical protein